MSENEKPQESSALKGEAADGVNGSAQNGNIEKKPTNPLATAKDKVTEQKQKIKEKQEPAGGFDPTPIPLARDGFTVRFTFHRAENLPVSDLNSRSSDPYLTATLISALPKRHKEDPDLVLRTKTIHKQTNPQWDQSWTVAGIPASGFRLKCRLYDEDPSDHDDRLGNVTIHVNQIGLDWPGIREEGFDIKKRMASKRAYILRGCVSMLNKEVHMSGTLFVSAEVLGESEPPHGRMYTIAETCWTKHYSPMIGRLAGTKAPGSSEGGEGVKTEKYE